ncbi:MAG: silent information regulator protein Sir2, partial [Lachnospira sp.]
GWDLFAKTATGPIGKVTLRNCVAFGNGTLTNGIHYANGDMNGFKLGGSGVGTPHSVFNCLAFNNGACGFTDNNNPSALTVLNCTAYDNAKEDSNKYNFNFGRAKAGLYMNLIASKGAAQSDSFMGAVLNTTYRNSKDFYHVTTKTTFAGKEKLGEKVSDPSSVGAFKNINNTIDVTKSIDSQLRNADGTINMKGLYETTGEYSSMGARYNVKSQVITVALSATSGGNGEETTTVAPTSAPTSAPTQAPTSAPTQAPTSAPTQAPTSAPTQAPTVAPTQAPTEPVKSETLILKSDDVSTGTYTDSFVVKGFVITANSVNSVVVDGNNKTLGSDSFASRIKTGGEGTSAYRTVAFKTNGASTITIAAMSSSSKETRTIQILDKDGNVVSSVDGVGGKTLSAYTLTVPSAGVYYIGSKSSGLNIYKLTVTNAIALTSVSDLGEAPTEAPTEVPTEAPTEAPTSAPTQAPTSAPTVAPTQAPTSAPTVAPTTAPTTAPTQAQTTVSSTEGTTKAGEVGADVDDVTSESKTNITASSEETVSSEEAASTAKAGQVAADTSKTGDSSMAWLYAVIALIACGAIGGTYIVSKKHRA